MDHLNALYLHACHFPQFFYFGFAVYLTIPINKKDTLRNYCSIDSVITQRVIIKFRQHQKKNCFVWYLAAQRRK